MTAVESKTEERLTELEANHEYKVKLYSVYIRTERDHWTQ